MKKIKRAAAMFLALCCAAVCLPAAAAGNDEKGLEFKFASPVTLENGKTAEIAVEAPQGEYELSVIFNSRSRYIYIYAADVAVFMMN